jgi:hypothetical protein
VRALYLALVVQHFVELRQRQLFVHRTRFHSFVQGLHRILQLPLQFVKARRRAIDLGPHERLLIIGQSQLTLMLHHHLWREHRIAQRIHWRTRRLSLTIGLGLLRLIRLLGRYQRRA